MKRGPRCGCWSPRHLVLALAAIGLAATVTVLPTSGAVYTSSTNNLGNSLATGTLAAPAGLSAVQRCPIPSAVGAVTADRSGGTIDLVVPAAAAAGDLLIVHLVNDNSSSPPTGWSLLTSLTASAGNLQSSLYQRVATVGDPSATYSFTVTGAKAAGAMLVIRDTSGLIAADHAASSDNGSTSSVTAPSVTTTANDSLLVSFFGIKSGGRSFSQPAGMTETYDFGGANVSLAADYELRSTSGTTGTRSATASASAGAIGLSVAVTRADRPEVDLSWTPTGSLWGTGHEVLRNGTVVATTTPRTMAGWTDTSPVSGSTAYAVQAYFGNWRSAQATTSVTVGCA